MKKLQSNHEKQIKKFGALLLLERVDYILLEATINLANYRFCLVVS